MNPTHGERLIAVKVGAERPRLTGKVALVNGRWVFYRDQRKANQFHALGNGFAVDAVVVDAIKEEVADIHFRLGRTLLTVPFGLFVNHATRIIAAGREQYVLPRVAFEESDERYRLEFIPVSRTQVLGVEPIAAVVSTPITLRNGAPATAQQPSLI